MYSGEDLKATLEPLDDPEKNVIIQQASLSKIPIVKDALLQEIAFRQKTEVEIANLIYTIKQLIENTEVFSLEGLYKEVLDRLRYDYSSVLELNQIVPEFLKQDLKIPNLNPDQPDLNIDANKQTHTHTQKLQAMIECAKRELGFSFKTHKMLEAITGATEFLTKQNFHAVLETEEMPVDFRFSTSLGETTMLGDQRNIYGNSKGTFLKTALVTIYNSLKKQFTLAPWIESPIAHVTSLPNLFNSKNISEFLPSENELSSGVVKDEFSPELKKLVSSLKNVIAQFEHSTYHYSDAKTPNGFSFIHSGYAFGGHRFESRYPNGKAYGPEDCSSWIGKLTRVSDSISTEDLLYTYRRKVKDGIFPVQWEQGKEGKALLSLYEPITVRDPQKDIQAGDVYSVRSFRRENDPGMNKTSGIGGHTTLILGTQKNGDMVTIGYGRDMPIREGFGIETFSYNPEPVKDITKKVMVFRLRHDKKEGGQICQRL